MYQAINKQGCVCRQNVAYVSKDAWNRYKQIGERVEFEKSQPTEYKYKLCTECNETRKQGGNKLKNNNNDDDCSTYGEHGNFDNNIKKVYHNVMSLQIDHGGDKHRILVEGRKDRNLKLCDVMKQIEKELKVPADEQRIFYKGMELQKFASSELETLGVFQNSMLRVSGKSGNENWMDGFMRFN